MMKFSEKLSRRDFVKLCGSASLALAAAPVLVPLAEAAAGPGRYVQTRLKMGTTVTLTAVTDSADHAQEAFDAAWKEMDRLIGIFDRHQSGTAISELNTSGKLSGPAPEMIEVLNRADNVHKLSGGAFDPTIVPVLSLIERSFSGIGRPPKSDDIARMKNLVDFTKVSYSKNNVKLGMAGQEISLDGVAKGFIVDQAAKAMAGAGLRNALINAGGDISAMGVSHRGEPWRIGIQDPSRRNSYVKVVALTDQSVATSGSYEIFYDSDKNYHHLLNPVDGKPAINLTSSTVVSNSAAMADAMATAVFIKPELLTSAKADGFIISRNGRQSATKGFKMMIRS